jgi:hypothetical protein
VTRRARIAAWAGGSILALAGVAGLWVPRITFGRDGLPGGEGEDADVGIPTIPLQR